MDADFKVVPGDDGTFTVTVTGEIDFTCADFLATVFLAELMERRPPMASIDLGGVRFIDSQGLSALVSCYHSASDAGCRLRLTNATGTPARLLDITGVRNLFETGS